MIVCCTHEFELQSKRFLDMYRDLFRTNAQLPRASVFFVLHGRVTQRSFGVCSCPSHLFGSGVCRPFGVFPCAGTVGALSDIEMCVRENL